MLKNDVKCTDTKAVRNLLEKIIRKNFNLPSSVMTDSSQTRSFNLKESLANLQDVSERDTATDRDSRALICMLIRLRIMSGSSWSKTSYIGSVKKTAGDAYSTTGTFHCMTASRINSFPVLVICLAFASKVEQKGPQPPNSKQDRGNGRPQPGRALSCLDTNEIGVGEKAQPSQHLSASNRLILNLPTRLATTFLSYKLPSAHKFKAFHH